MRCSSTLYIRWTKGEILIFRRTALGILHDHLLLQMVIIIWLDDAYYLYNTLVYIFMCMVGSLFMKRVPEMPKGASLQAAICGYASHAHANL